MDGDTRKWFLVTGGAGFIGSHIVRHLLRENHNVVIVDNFATGLEKNIPPDVEFFDFDLSDKNAYSVLDNYRFDAVYHLAGQSSGALSFLNPLVDFKSHALSTFNLLTWGKEKEIFDRLLYASSTTVYGDPATLPVAEAHPTNPKTFYSAGKLAAEAYIAFFHNQGIRSTIFRMPNVYGPGQNLSNKNQGMISIYLSYILQGEPILVKGAADRFRDFIFIDDVVHAWLQSTENEKTFGKIYNLGTGKKVTVGQVLACLRKAFGRDDYPIHFVDGTPGDQTGFVCDNSMLCKHLGWSPDITVSDGILQMVEYEIGKNDEK